ncbi:type II toxin-antitoxin system RelE/ParE family toxin [Candidatus Halobeggiatoa sp. HSG11]|nr:type II toxin-antitoxin system RelE/ParE family toxin [Candidatus Halobeggiatoa sp. HSG11]
MYSLRFDKDAEKAYRNADKNLVKRLNRCFDYLHKEPFNHPNISQLKGNFAGLYRYKIGNWRIIYEVEEEQQVVNILQIINRGNAYKKKI